MTTDELVALRKAAGFNQDEMARRMGLAVRAYQDIEKAPGSLKARHQAMAERALLTAAIEQKDPMLVPASVRKEALALAGMITG